jgi:dipeptidyl-peptidase-3
MKSEIEAVQDTLLNQKIFLQNTRLKKKEEDGEISYELLLASAERRPSDTPENKVRSETSSVEIQFTYGDHSTELQKVVNHIAEATKYSRSETQTTYLDKNVHHFRSGNMQDHIDASIYWVKDKSAPVETCIGFQESYRDPMGLRCEWEGLVAIQNKSETETLGLVAERAKDFIRLLPWCQNDSKAGPGDLGPFENSTFVKPDFVSLQGMEFLRFTIPMPMLNLI